MSCLDLYSTYIENIRVMSHEGTRHGCSMLLSKGRRKGSPCGRKIKVVEQFCKFHSVKPEPARTCSMVLTKGARKTETCNRRIATPEHTLCKLHWISESKRPKNPYLEYEQDIKIVQKSAHEIAVVSKNRAVCLSKLNPQLALRLKEIKS